MTAEATASDARRAASRRPGGPGPFTEEEIAAATGPAARRRSWRRSSRPTIDEDERRSSRRPSRSWSRRASASRAERVRTVLESLLFVADKPLTLDQLYEATGIDRAADRRRRWRSCAAIHRDGVSGIVLHEVGRRLAVPHRPGLGRVRAALPQGEAAAADPRRARDPGDHRLPPAGDPARRSRTSAGSTRGAVLKALLERRLIKILGKKEEVGRPILYGTTREFLEFFALKDLSALPTLREFQELSEEHQEIVEKEAPGPKPTAEGTVAALADPDFEQRLEETPSRRARGARGGARGSWKAGDRRRRSKRRAPRAEPPAARNVSGEPAHRGRCAPTRRPERSRGRRKPMTERLQKFLARAGVASRRHAEELIAAGRVSVNNQAVTELGTKVEPGKDLVTVDGKLVDRPGAAVVLPALQAARSGDHAGRPPGPAHRRPTTLERRRRRGVFPVGRLDYDAEGALLLTDDGELAHQLMHPSFQVPRTYLAKVKGEPSAETLDKLRDGVRLEDGMATPPRCELFETAEKNTWLEARGHRGTAAPGQAAVRRGPRVIRNAALATISSPSPIRARWSRERSIRTAGVRYGFSNRVDDIFVRVITIHSDMIES